MKAVMILIIMDGIATGVYSSSIPSLVPPGYDDDTANKIAGITMVSLGVGSVIGAYFNGKFTDKVGYLLSGKIGIFFWVISCDFFIAALFYPSIWLGQISGFLWGFAMFYMEGWLYTICSLSYDGVASAFSVNKLVHSLLYLFYQIAVFTTSNSIPLKWIMTGMVLLTIPSLLYLKQLPNKSSIT